MHASESAPTLTHLPFLTPDQFSHACEELQRTYDACIAAHGHSTLPLQVDLYAKDASGRSRGLRLKRSVQLPDQCHPLPTAADDAQRDPPEEEDADLLEAVDEIDEHVVYPDAGSAASTATVEYDILLSPTYQVPVLYFRLASVAAGYQSGLDFVYRYLVPTNALSRLQQTSVMGGVSLQNHPVTDAPCFSVHPCNTPEAMRELLGTEVVSGLQYLQIWCGLIGASVGLHLPKELAVAN